MEDEKIVELYLKRNESAIKATAEKYGNRILGISLGITGDIQSAEECENDTYLETWNTVPPHEPRDYLYAFLARIARHISLNMCRTRNTLKRKAFISELSDELEKCIPSPDDTECRIDGIMLGEAVSRFLRQCSEEKRNIFLRRYWYMDSIAEIALRFSMSQSKIKSSLFRTRNELKKFLEREGYDI